MPSAAGFSEVPGAIRYHAGSFVGNAAMNLRRGLPVLFCCIATLFAGCAQVGAPRQETPDAVAADQAYGQGNFDEAARDFLALADAHPRDGPRPDRLPAEAGEYRAGAVCVPATLEAS